MKTSGILIIVVVIAAFLSMFSTFNTEINTKYTSNETAYVNDSSWATRFDQSDHINATIGKLKSNFDVITDPDKGFFTKVASGIVAIPYAVILFPLTIFDGATSLGSIFTGLTSDFQVDSGIIAKGLILLIVIVVVALIEFFQRSPA